MGNNIDDLRHIRSMMERSTKFLSISGKSGIVAGLTALIGAVFVYELVYEHAFSLTNDVKLDVFIIALLVLGIAVFGGLFFSWQKAKRTNQKFWSSATREILKDAGVPLFCGGVFCLILMYHDVSYLIASTMLLFCGIACVNAGARSYRDIKILGTGLIILGLCAGVWSSFGLFFWAIGFGVLFIIYGIVLYRKYDVMPPKN